MWEASNGQLKLSPNLKVSKLAGKVMLFKLWLKSWKAAHPTQEKNTLKPPGRQKEKTTMRNEST